MVVRRILVTVFALWWVIQAFVMFGCTSVKFDGMTAACFDAPAGAVDGGYFSGWATGLVVLALAATMLVWMWIVPKVRLVRARRHAAEAEVVEEAALPE